MNNRPTTIETQRSLPKLRVEQEMARWGYHHAGLHRFMDGDGNRATVKLIRPGRYSVTYTDAQALSALIP